MARSPVPFVTPRLRPPRRWARRPAGLLAAIAAAASALAGVPVDLSGLAPGSPITAALAAERLTLEWPAAPDGTNVVAVLSLLPDAPLLESLALRAPGAATPREIGRALAPYVELTVGERDLRRNGWMVFFDKVNTRPAVRHALRLAPSGVRVTTTAARGTVEIAGLAGGGFSGHLVLHCFAGSPLLQIEAAVSTPDDARAILYDAGLRATGDTVRRYAWVDPEGRYSTTPASVVAGVPRAVKFRTVVAQTAGGALAVFPPPHRFFYPLDFADNFAFNFAGRDYDSDAPGQSWGVRQPPDGDRRFAPWVNAPPGTRQRLPFFVLLSAGAPDAALESVKRYTHADRFAPLAGHRTFASHFHVEHTIDLLEAQQEAGTDAIPGHLRLPGFVRAFREAGVDIVHLGEFHFGWTPRLDAATRLAQLQAMHAECARLSDDRFLLLPGEEPNAHLGGHWMSLFPRPVYWVLNRPAGTPFAQNTPDGRTLYHVGSPDDIVQLMEREGGLMWTAHARIKSSIGFPDQYRDQAFFRSDRFLGAAWKAMPADYSRDRLGERVLDLLDDMANWGRRKQVLGEVDVFRIEPGSELYGHMNINYLELASLPRFDDGWQPVLDALRQGRFFVTTGEVLLSGFRADDTPSGGSVRRPAGGQLTLRARLAWTFPLAFAEVVTGDGSAVERRRVDLADTREFGERELRVEVSAATARWVRLEAWDVAGNGAFTQPVWIE